MSDLPITEDKVTIEVSLPELAILIYGLTEVGVINAENILAHADNPEVHAMLMDADEALNKLYMNLIDVFDIAVL